ncbi:SDR family NAD(P)-dependent oxidoreductase [Thiocapsa rosea]|uniref:NAD(P)-dependent dehydrogenase (Short-subunit alcohol dehydrogenase family) n=1 Tax=Thiocapsa rosea TaxID=69360 RepID=A0A495V4E9_9GAMM|nr:SDR family oxidoreductase [Thiocapsa rosea]RKT43550.1 NAD(P)-dependent dehydrogenase (short-subunit alcohol dehydrogenase family) [Thiocapsa rosea]
MNLLVVTGASAGIGRAIATRFLVEGSVVVNLSRRPCTERGVENLACDLAQPEAIERIADRLTVWLADAERICLVHSASVMRRDTIDALPSEELRAVLELNLVAANALNQLVLPHMSAGSSIIYIGSTLAEKAVPGVASYVIAKHALAGMMRSTCQDLAGRGIHTCMICPGFTDTEQIRAMIDGDPDTLAALAGMSAFDRLIEPEEIADTVAFAAHAPVLNGALIHANLGQRER